MNICQKFKIVLVLLILWSSVSFAQKSKTETLQSLVEQALSAEQNYDVASAVNLYGQIVDLCRELNDTAQLPNLLYSYGQVLTYNGNYKEAIEVLIETHSLCKNNPELEARVMMAFGTVNYFMNQLDDALDYYQQAGKMSIEIGNLMGASIAENNVATVYQRKHDYENAINSYNKSLQMQQSINDSATICNTYFNIATCNQELGNTDNAERLFRQALKIATSIKDIEMQALSLTHLGTIMIANGESDGFNSINQAENLAKKHGYGQVLNEILLIKCRSLENVHRYAEALECYKQYKNFSDSTINLKSISQLNDFKAKYETLQKDHQIAIHEATINRQKIQRLALIIGLVLALIALLLFIRLITVQRIRNKELVELSKSKDMLFSLISHDLKNPAIAQRNAIQNLIELADFITPQMLKEHGALLLQSAESLVDLLQNLLNWSRMELGRMPYKPIHFDLNAVITESINVLQVSAENKRIKFNVKSPNEVVAFADKNMITAVVRNLMQNAIKYSHRNGEISIEIAEHPQSYSVSIIDNGVGMTKEQVDTIFSVERNRSTVGTSGEIGSGLGLIVCNDMINQNHGTLAVASEEGKGSTFTFTINR